MKLTAGLVFAWTLVAASAWLAERSFRHQRHVQRQSELLSRDSEAAAFLIASRQWPSPLQESPPWKELERKFEINMLPANALANKPTAEAVPGVVQRGQRLVTTATVAIQMTDGTEKTAVQIAISRTLPRLDSASATATIAALYLAGLGLLGLASLRGYQRLREHTAALSGWADAIEKHRPGDLLQLRKLPSETELASYLNIVADRTNEAFSGLYNAKHRSDLVLDNLKDGVLAVNENSQLLLLGGAIDKHLNLSIDTYLYRPLLEVVRVPQVTDLIEQVFDSGSPREGVFDIATSGKYLRLIARPIALGEQRTGVILNTRDETLLKRIEAVRTDFIANASHELKTPLAAIRAYAETLQMGALEDPPAAEGFVNGIVTQADRIGGLIQGMLQLSRIESGTGLRIEPFDATEAIGPCLAAASAMASSKEVNFSFTTDDQPLEIYSDLNGFQTIASNLLSNAIRYTPPGGKVTASLNREADSCILVVEDTGIGIRKEDLERIFERFYRAEKDRSSETGGTGLGLSIVKHMTNGLGGSVTARSQLGQGSRFLVCLPCNSSSD